VETVGPRYLCLQRIYVDVTSHLKTASDLAPPAKGQVYAFLTISSLLRGYV
jgi:hypothetical protein